nr:MAG TPA: hypothetical protein [Caudoviricetes sp.]
MVQIPLTSGAQFFNIALGEEYYTLKLSFRDANYGGWFLDIASLDGENVISGIPLVCGVDLLAQYQYLGLGHLYAFVNGLYTKEPEYADMGRDLQLFWEA